MVYHRPSGQVRELTRALDRSVSSFAWAPDSGALFFVAEDRGEAPIWCMPLEANQPTEVARTHGGDLVFGAKNQLFFGRMSIMAPTEIARLDVSGVQNSASRVEPVAVTYMNEALLRLLEFGFTELDLNRVEGDVDPRNVASAKSLERLGFKREGLLRERWIVGGEVSDTALYGLLRSEWRISRRAG